MWTRFKNTRQCINIILVFLIIFKICNNYPYTFYSAFHKQIFIENSHIKKCQFHFFLRGSELTDVSIVKKLPNVEVLSLRLVCFFYIYKIFKIKISIVFNFFFFLTFSVNDISSLEDFAFCNNLQELYIRKNKISELGEIRHLKDLVNLRNLWLADNPCAESDDYRLTVIRALPQLQKLDNMRKSLKIYLPTTFFS